jgi:polar amino acid transport system permease protein
MRAWHWGGFFHYLLNPYLAEGALITVWLTAAAMTGGLALGLVVALCRMSGRRELRMLAGFYGWLFRGTPLLVQLLMIYTALPLIGIRLSVVATALTGLSLNEAAYLSEILRAGLLAVPLGQRDAARALGLSRYQTLRRVIGPQAMRVIIPPLGNSVNGMLKTTSLTSVVSMEELLRRTQILVQEQFMVLELFTIAALYYLALTSAWSLVQMRIEKRFGRAFALTEHI